MLRNHRTTIAAAACLCISACAIGAPPGFSAGDQWTTPLVGGVGKGPLVTPVWLNGKGPFLFYLNPHSMSVLDPRIAKSLGVWVKRTSGKATDQSDTISQEQLDFADVLSIKVGDLTIRNRKFVLLPTGGEVMGHPVVGTIGSDLFAESLVWQIDRDQSVVRIAAQGGGITVGGATGVKGRVERGRLFVDVVLNGQRQVELLVDLVSLGSAVWHEIAAAALESLQPGSWRARTVTVGDRSVRGMTLRDYADKRVRKRAFDGLLGREFWSQFVVTVNLHKKSIWLAPRAPHSAANRRARLARWGEQFAGCTADACVTAHVERSQDESLAKVVFVREPGGANIDMAVTAQAVDASGKRVDVDELLVAFPPGATKAWLPPKSLREYGRAANFVIVDVSPYSPDCNAQPSTGCVWRTQVDAPGDHDNLRM